jgi:hypothetical protein
MSTKHSPRIDGYEFIIYPHTGIQICRGLSLPKVAKQVQDELWRAAGQAADRAERENDQLVHLLSENVACIQGLKEAGKATGWIRCASDEFAFFRLVRSGEDLVVDLFLDTERGAGARANGFPSLLYGGPLTAMPDWLVPPRILPLLHSWIPRLCAAYVPAHFRVDSPKADTVGTLIMDFGNSGSAFVFTPYGSGAIRGDVLKILNPFDPNHARRPKQEANILRSNLSFLRVDDNPREDPWVVMGSRAEELIRMEPAATFVSAPKKYVRYWPERLKTREPYFPVRGLLGWLAGQQPSHFFIRQGVRHMLQSVLASLTNPDYRDSHPCMNPQFDQIMVTYPLTWRDSDKELFRQIVEEIARGQLSFREEWKAKFRVELVCSEPVAVAAYILWEAFFHFGTSNLALLTSALGNYSGTNSVRLLVIDMGGGSTDVAVVEVDWSVKQSDRSVDVRFQLLESMRFNRAGDRVSHLIATSIREFLRTKYAITESLSLRSNASNINFSDRHKRRAISKIFELSEAAKAELSTPGCKAWELRQEDEAALIELFKPLLEAHGTTRLQALQSAPPRLIISHETLARWVRADRQCPESNNEPGFMDIFLYLRELTWSLEDKNRRPHLVVLSGRASRLPFIRDFAAEHLYVPPHHIRTLSDLWPPSLTLLGHANMDKLAVVLGAQRFRFGDNIRFFSLPDEPIFNRYIGTIMETPEGLKLQEIHIRQGESRPRTLSLQIDPAHTIRIGHAFREDGLVQVLATVENRSGRTKQVHLQVEDDFTVQLKTPDEDIVFVEWVPGGADVIVDNFNDTGEIDGLPQNLIRNHILTSVAQDRWITDPDR